jgi:hypothetical protein
MQVAAKNVTNYCRHSPTASSPFGERKIATGFMSQSRRNTGSTTGSIGSACFAMNRVQSATRYPWASPIPWRRKPARWLRYRQGPVNRDAGFRTVLVYCVGPPNGGPPQCPQSLPLPDWDWGKISAHFRCTKCGTVGYVDTRLDWGEVIDFNRHIG